MDRMVYEKPEMKMVGLENESKVADKCWGHAGKKQTLYTDLAGEGWASFQIAAGNCAVNLTNVMYHTDSNDNGIADIEDQGRVLLETDDKYKELKTKLQNAGGSDGQNFPDSEGIVIPNKPEGGWS